MKTIFNHPLMPYAAASLACLCIMIIIDYVLGSEAEHLNAWAILNKLFGRETGIEDSLALRQFGLAGATFLMLLVNAVLGISLVQLFKLITRLIHAQ